MPTKPKETTTEPYIKAPAAKVWYEKADSSMRTLMQAEFGDLKNLFYQWSVGRRGASAALALRIEEFTTRLYDTLTGAPKPVGAGDLCAACRGCPHYLKSNPPIRVSEEDEEDDSYDRI